MKIKSLRDGLAKNEVNEEVERKVDELKEERKEKKEKVKVLYQESQEEKLKLKRLIANEDLNTYKAIVSFESEEDKMAVLKTPIKP